MSRGSVDPMYGAREARRARGGLRRFVLVVLLMFLGILVVAIGIAVFGPDGGLLPFSYEGF